MVETYKCPGCGAPITYNGEAGTMVCDYCGTKVDVSKIDKEKDKYSFQVENQVEEKNEYNSFDGYRCENCGAEVITDANTSATFCSFCGSPAIIKNRLEGTLAPKQLIPFKLSKEKAVDSYKKWTRKGPFTPSGFKKQSTIEKITGMYVPFWLYDYKAESTVDANCTRVRKETRGNTEYTYTSHFKVHREIEAVYDKIPADASEKMPDNYMDLLEPFNYNEIEPFSMPYLSGFQSEKYNYDAAQLAPRAENRVSGFMYEEARNSIKGYTSTSIYNNDLRMKRRKADYTLLPVWILNYNYKGKMYMFAMNGQTGKVVGDLPKSPGKIAAWSGGIFAGLFAILMLLGGLFG